MYIPGMEALQTAISYWEDAIKSYVCRGGPLGDSGAKPLPVTTAEEAEFSKELDNLLESAYKLQYECELLFLDQRSVLFRDDTSSVREWVTAGATRGSETSSRRNIASPTESFASAQDQFLQALQEAGLSSGWPALDTCFLYACLFILILIFFTIFALIPAAFLFLIIYYSSQEDIEY
ncbi:hypothetical protein J437_LFUL017312 [Ladona fulva]|uniref:Uncharacterized protein n=1 Tax=Ladona fulva TaxID=123851 RepID=A0A8K0KPB8_LADFU|nr:hypothetical protein J437_LFUL017312 [Ladona fulva]